MGTTSAAARRRWKDPAARKKQSAAVRRSVKPISVPLPPRLEQLADVLTQRGVEVISVLPALERDNPENSWWLSATDIEATSAWDRWRPHLDRFRVRALRMYSQPRRAGGSKVVCLLELA